jgi:hypothetical protein
MVHLKPSRARLELDDHLMKGAISVPIRVAIIRHQTQSRLDDHRRPSATQQSAAPEDGRGEDLLIERNLNREGTEVVGAIGHESDAQPSRRPKLVPQPS